MCSVAPDRPFADAREFHALSAEEKALTFATAFPDRLDVRGGPALPFQAISDLLTLDDAPPGWS